MKNYQPPPSPHIRGGDLACVGDHELQYPYHIDWVKTRAANTKKVQLLVRLSMVFPLAQPVHWAGVVGADRIP